MGVGGRYRT